MNWTLLLALSFFIATVTFLLFQAGRAVCALIVFLIKRRKDGLKNKDTTTMATNKKIL